MPAAQQVAVEPAPAGERQFVRLPAVVIGFQLTGALLDKPELWPNWAQEQYLGGCNINAGDWLTRDPDGTINQYSSLEFEALFTDKAAWDHAKGLRPEG